MHNNDEYQELLEKIKAYASHPESAIYGSEYYWLYHQLAEDRYIPARDFLIKELDDPRWDWRRESIRLLGFHFKLEEEILNKIRSFAINDPDDGVRITAVSVIGNQGKMPEPALIKAIQLDSNRFVREAAFDAILDLCGVSYKINFQEVTKVKEGLIQPTLEEVKKILLRENLSNCLEFLTPNSEIGT